MMTRLDRLLSLCAALVACGLLLVGYPATPTPAPAGAVPFSVAWPHALNATITSTLPDQTAYQPAIFLDAQTSVGTAPDPRHRAMRLLLRGGTGPPRQLRSLPLAQSPWFGGFAQSGTVLTWAERTNSGPAQLWTVNLHDNRAARPLTADLGDAMLDGTPYDLVIAESRVHWAAADPHRRDTTQIRSVALTGGPVEVHVEPGTWQLSSWPWLVNGRDAPAGTTTMRNMLTERDVAIAGTDRQTTHCTPPSWCVTVTLADDGYRVDLMHPDGTGRQPVASGQLVPEIDDVVALDRFVVVSRVASYSDLTATRQLQVFDINTNRTVELSSGARTASYSNGMLWWSTGAQDAPVWHALDLRTV